MAETLHSCRDAQAVIVRDLAVTYEVFQDHQRRSLKALVSQGLSRTPPRTVDAVRGVSFDLHVGEGLGLIGANGAGKTTLLRAIAGLLPASRGRILARSEPVLLGVGAALHPELSARRNVYLGGTALGMSREQVEERFDYIIDFAGVRDYVNMPLRAYSSGMSARLRFAIASAVEPDILLIDEALAVGDAEFRRRSSERMREVIAKAGTLVLVSHNLSSIQELCSRVIWMHHGRVRVDGPTDAVLGSYREFVSAG